MKFKQKKMIKKLDFLIKVPFFCAFKTYQKLLRPWLGQQCRFYPTCSDYAILSFKRLNIFSALTCVTYRLCRCQPYAQSKIDWPPKR
jgi:uncharacterized protein